MAKIHRLTQKQLNEAVKEAVPKLMMDGGGLVFSIRPGGTTYFYIQVTVTAPHGRGKRVIVNLGQYPTLTLAGAREKANEVRTTAAQGIDPRTARKDTVAENHRERLTFEAVALLAFAAKQSALKADGKAGRWFSPLKHHIIPTLGEKPIETIDQHALVDTLRQLWSVKPATAVKALTRTAAVFRHAAAMDLAVSLETTAKARILLGKPKHTVEHISSLPWEAVPEFYASLDDQQPAHLALKLLLLTGARSFPIRHAHVDQFNGDTWHVPAENMKGGETFSIPLSTEAKRIVEHATTLAKGGYLFNRHDPGLMSEVLKERKLDARPHGMRTTLRSWLSENTDASWDIREKILAHKIGDETSRAYDRTSEIKKRAAFMESWGQYCASKVFGKSKTISTEEIMT